MPEAAARPIAAPRWVPAAARPTCTSTTRATLWSAHHGPSRGGWWRVECIVTDLTRPAESVVALHNHRGTAERWPKEGKAAVRWTRPSCRSFAANAVRLPLHALAHNLGTFPRTLASPEGVEPWPLTTLRERLAKIGAKVVSHGRCVTFQMAEVAVPRRPFAEVPWLIGRPRAPPGSA
jgi:Transposase DDE domain group 1